MKNKGFTLVELLAVIAILAILVIIALPNVMGMFNQAKKNSFMTEVKEVYKLAQQQWMSDSMFNTGVKSYARTKNTCSSSLDLSGREELQYYIKIDKSGKVSEYYATDGTYQYKYTGGDLKIENIKDAQDIAGISEDEKLELSCSGLATPTDVSYFGYYENNGEITIYSYSNAGPKDVVIPAKIEGKPVTIIDTNAFSYMNLTSVVLPDTIRVIGGSDDLGAFAYNNLTSVELPRDLEEIGSCAFTSNKIKRLVIPDKVKYIAYAAFDGNEIETLTLGSSVEIIEVEAFGSNKLTTLVVPPSVKVISPGINGPWVYGAAFGANQLRSVTIKGKSSASEFDEPLKTIIHGNMQSPFGWANDVTCVKDNETNVENGCIIWEP